MIRALSSLVGVVLAVSLTLPVSAQAYEDPRGFRIKKRAKDFRDIAADTPPEETLLRTAECLVKERPTQVQNYLRTVSATSEEEAAFAKIEKKINSCIPNMDMSSVGNMTAARGLLTVRFEHSALRGALAEGLMRENKIVIDPDRVNLGDDGMLVAEKFHGARSDDPGRSFSLGFAGCVMGNNPSALSELFKTTPGSMDEKTAIVDMAPSFGQCVMEGQELKLSAPTLRNQLAEVTYYAMFLEAVN